MNLFSSPGLIPRYLRVSQHGNERKQPCSIPLPTDSKVRQVADNVYENNRALQEQSQNVKQTLPVSTTSVPPAASGINRLDPFLLNKMLTLHFDEDHPGEAVDAVFRIMTENQNVLTPANVSTAIVKFGKLAFENPQFRAEICERLTPFLSIIKADDNRLDNICVSSLWNGLGKLKLYDPRVIDILSRRSNTIFAAMKPKERVAIPTALAAFAACGTLDQLPACTEQL